MRFGVLFCIVATLLAAAAVTYRGWYLMLLWPVGSCLIVAAGYLHLGPVVYGKSKTGSLSRLHQVVLLPYLVLMWSVWHILRWTKREPPWTQVTERITMGRRLLPHEFPATFDHVIDLTCEFNAIQAFGKPTYHSFPILDGHVPTPDELRQWAFRAAGLSGNLYVHCAEGHGRSGMFVAALLVASGRAKTVDEALRIIQSKRPLARLRRGQLAVLRQIENGTATGR